MSEKTIKNLAATVQVYFQQSQERGLKISKLEQQLEIATEALEEKIERSRSWKMIRPDRFIFEVDNYRVIDGDSIKLDIEIGEKPVDLGFGVTYMVPSIKRRKKSYRLFGINAPETKGEEKEKGLICKEYLKLLLSNMLRLRIETIPDKNYEDTNGKFGRYLIKILPPESKDIVIRSVVKHSILRIIHTPEKTINQHLVDQGYAKIYFGRGDRHKFPKNELYPLEIKK